ncbi:mannitol dehydrogenase family protein [Enterococcus avium]
MKKALIIGAGNIGRGVVGYLLNRDGYKLSFYDVHPEHLIEMKNLGGYSVFVDDNNRQTEFHVSDFLIIDSDKLSKALEEHDFIFCCVYEGAFKSIAENLARAIQDCEKNNFKNVMLCVNSLGAPQKFVQYISEYLKDDPLSMEYFNEKVGINQVMVLSAALPLPKELSENYPYAVMITANPHLEIDGITFTGKKPEILDVEFVDNAEGRIYRKVYVGNMRHTMAAFIGAIEGLTYIYESQQDPRIRPWLEKAFDEAHQAIKATYDFDMSEDKYWVDYMQEKLNQVIKDPIERVIVNPELKLGPSERFIGPAKLCLKENILPMYIAKGTAYGLKYLQKKDQRSIDELLAEVCGLNKENDFVLYQLIKKQTELI